MNENKLDFLANKNLKQLFGDLRKKDLDLIRKNWEFKGMSNLNKPELIEELNERIPRAHFPSI